jgi:DNA-binding beta-propeller fold protein YncE
VKLARPLGFVCLAFGIALPLGCSSSPISVPLRSLERSGSVSFVCIARPGTANPTDTLDKCHAFTFAIDKGDLGNPHLIALVTQTARGEVAVVDTSAQTVLDEDPTTPGQGFIPVGQIPTDIVSTKVGSASFVTVADPDKPGIFALPTASILPGSMVGPPELTSFPACSLRAYPGRMIVLDDTTPAGGGTFRRHCPSAPPADPDAAPAPELPLESIYGTPKLLVELPDLGEIDVIDATDLLARPNGSYDKCPVEAKLTLRGSGGVEHVAASPDAGAEGTITQPALLPRPSGMALSDDGRLFVADETAPIIHVIDATSPCDLVEGDPLLATSTTDPLRVVTTRALAVSPQTSETPPKRYVYAVDLNDAGTIMVFDVSDDATARTPLPLSDPVYLPYMAPDRISFGVPVQAVAFARHEVTVSVPNLPASVYQGVPCDPTNGLDPNHAPTGEANYSGPGAGPLSLRGVFGFAVLSSGQIAVLDVEDLDAACRRPQASDAEQLGCKGAPLPVGGYPAASNESSCRMVEPHRVRAARYFVGGSGLQNAPMMQFVPLLRNADGTVLSVDTAQPAYTTRPRMLGPNFEGSDDDKRTKTIVAATGGGVTGPDKLSPFPYNDDKTHPPDAQDPAQAIASTNWVAFDLHEPRAHYNQSWAMTYEGLLPSFGGHLGTFTCSDSSRRAGAGGTDTCEAGTSPADYVFYDSSAAFCSYGVQGTDLAAQAGFGTGDILAIADPLPDPADPYWTTVGTSCSYDRCNAAFGAQSTGTTIALLREREIAKAYQDHLVLKPRQPPAGLGPLPLTCCFPYPVTYTIRGGAQWIVTGSASGFEHHGAPDPAADAATAPCVILPDDQYPNLRLRNGRARTLTHADAAAGVPTWDDTRLFRNSQLRFGIWEPPGVLPDTPCDQCAIVRGLSFGFDETGAFVGLVAPLSSNYMVLPQSVQLVPSIERLAIPDAMSQGLIMFSLDRVAVSESYL